MCDILILKYIKSDKKVFIEVKLFFKKEIFEL